MRVAVGIEEGVATPPMQGGWRLALLGCVSFFFASIASELVARQLVGLSALWPANAMLLGLLLTRVRRPQDAVSLMVGAGVGSAVASIVRMLPPLQCLLFPLANLFEAGTAALILRHLGGKHVAFDKVRSVLALVIACCVAPLLPAALGAVAVIATTPASFAAAWTGWYVAGALSLALVTPAVVVAIHLTDSARDRPIAVRRLSEVILILGLVAIVAEIVFATRGKPLLFTVLPFVLLATFRLRQLGAVAAVGIVAVIAVHATSLGLGPIAQATPDHVDQFLFLQFFLAVSFVTSLPVAAALAERDARAHEAHLLADHFKAVVENAGEVIFRTDLTGCWTYLNPAWETISGYRTAESIGQPLFACVDVAEQEKLADWARPVFAGEVRATRRMLRFHTASGNLRWMELSIQGLCDKDGAMMGATGTLRDIDDRKRLEEHVLTAKRRAEERARAATVLASTDELTGLANRRAFLRHLDRQTEAANEFGWRLTVAMFDVDHFKRVNDRFGHAVGDRVLQLVAARANAICRSGDLIGRLGGEEFGILMPSASAEDAANVAERLRQAIEAPFDTDGGVPLPSVTVSIGVASQERSQTGADLLAGADAALYAAKEAGRNRVKVAA